MPCFERSPDGELISRYDFASQYLRSFWASYDESRSVNQPEANPSTSNTTAEEPAILHNHVPTMRTAEELLELDSSPITVPALSPESAPVPVANQSKDHKRTLRRARVKLLVKMAYHFNHKPTVNYARFLNRCDHKGHLTHPMPRPTKSYPNYHPDRIAPRAPRSHRIVTNMGGSADDKEVARRYLAKVSWESYGVEMPATKSSPRKDKKIGETKRRLFLGACKGSLYEKNRLEEEEEQLSRQLHAGFEE